MAAWPDGTIRVVSTRSVHLESQLERKGRMRVNPIRTPTLTWTTHSGEMLPRPLFAVDLEVSKDLRELMRGWPVPENLISAKQRTRPGFGWQFRRVTGIAVSFRGGARRRTNATIFGASSRAIRCAPKVCYIRLLGTRVVKRRTALNGMQEQENAFANYFVGDQKGPLC